MKVAVVGKGGSGKTTTSGIVSRELARRGQRVVALDCDANANLALSLGMGVEVAEEMISVRERLDQGEEEHAGDASELLERFGRPGPDGMQFAVVQRIESSSAGCPCCGMSPQELLGELDEPDRIVIADMEAGIGTMTRIKPGAIDVAVLVVEPTAKSIDVGLRARELAVEKEVGVILVVANRVTGDEDLQMIRDQFPDVDIIVVPDDLTVRRADREGLSPTDVDADSPAVIALRLVADHLAPDPVAA